MTLPRRPSNPEPRRFGLIVRDLLIERGTVTDRLGTPDWPAFATELGVKYETLRKAVAGERPPGRKIMELAADALGVKPEDTFYEYQLLETQRQFDPREVGEDVAYANLQAWLKSQRAK
jgi:transcriptional regulator with XRE-family HTH domain